MKRIAILLAALLLLSACDGNQGAEETSSPPPDSPTGGPTGSPPYDAAAEIAAITDGYDDLFTYSNQESKSYNSFKCFTVDNDGVVYIFGVSAETEETEHGSILVDPTWQITAYDMHGGALATYELPMPLMGFRSLMCYGDGVIYLADGEFSHRDERFHYLVYDLYSYDLQTLELKRLDTPSNILTAYNAVKKLAYLDGKLYILGILEDYITDEYDIYSYTNNIDGMEIDVYRYQYDGRVLAAYDIESETFEIVFDDLIENFSPTPDGKIMICARDPQENDGWGMSYFQEIDPETMSLGDRVYRGIEQITTFATDGYGVLYDALIGPMTAPSGNLKYWPLGEDTGIIIMTSGGGMGGGVAHQPDAILYHNGFTFYLSSGNRKTELMRIRNSIKIAHPIKVIGTHVSGDIPREGHNIHFAALGHDEFALSVLAGGTAYDLAYVSSRQDFAYNLRDKGSFYPLNDVPGIQEFLDKCHPYIRDAATDKNGDIWMLPISINVEAVIYHEANCKKAGINFSNAAAVYDIIDSVNRGTAFDEGNYFFDKNTLLQKSMAKYIRAGTKLDAPAFRQTAESLKAFMPGEPALGGHGFNVVQDNDDFLFMNGVVQTSASIVNRDDLYVVPLTGTDGVNSADCVFLCVSPDSDKLERTLDYISAVCYYLADKADNFMLTDMPITSGYAKRLHALYQDAVTDFNVSDEVFADDFNKYLNGQITLDQLIKEAGRKLAMYLGE